MSIRNGWIMLLLAAPVAHAQIVTDGTLGPEIALKGPNFQVGAGLGRQVGPNLFFSFREFNLPTDSTATYTGPESILHIINRITGGSPSTIDGGIRVSGMPNANFWFINPAGVTFGANASIDVPASFYVSTADFLTLRDGGSFSASAPTTSSLTSAAPAAFGFLDASVGALTVNGATLQVAAGEEIAFVGGDIELDGGVLMAPGGRVQLASVGSTGQAQFDPSGTLSVAGFSRLGNISLSRTSEQANSLVGNINVSSADTSQSSGRVDLIGRTLTSDSGAILAVNRGSQSGGGITLDFSEAVWLEGFSELRTQSLRSGAGGDVTITTRQFTLGGDSQIVSDATGDGDGGDIRIESDSILLRDRGALASNAIRAGNGGTIELHAAGDLRMQDSSTIRVIANGAGDAGSIRLQGRNVFLSDSATLQASTFAGSTGDGGRIEIQAQERFELLGSGQGTLGDSALISSGANGTGNAGDIVIDANDVLIGGRALIETTASAGGNAGLIEVDTRSFTMTGGAALDSRTLASGVGGTIRVRADDMLLEQGARISTEAFGSGDAGDIEVSAADSLALIDSRIATSTTRADGGDIRIDVGGDVALDRSTIETSVQSGVGDGGNIAFAAGELVLLRDSRIEANAFGGDGGNIGASAGFFILSSNSAFQASSALGIDGTIRLSSPETDIASLAELATPQVVDVDQVDVMRCASSPVRTTSRIIIAAATDQSSVVADREEDATDTCFD